MRNTNRRERKEGAENRRGETKQMKPQNINTKIASTELCVYYSANSAVKIITMPPQVFTTTSI